MKTATLVDVVIKADIKTLDINFVKAIAHQCDILVKSGFDIRLKMPGCNAITIRKNEAKY